MRASLTWNMRPNHWTRRARPFVKPVGPLEIQKCLTCLPLATCDLRYVDKSLAYEHGTHARDFRICEETHEERLERWTKLQESTMTYQKPLAALEDEPELVAASPEELPSPAKKLPTATIAIIQSKVRKKLELAASPKEFSLPAKAPPTATIAIKQPKVVRRSVKERRRQEVESTVVDFLSGAVVFEEGRMPKYQCFCLGCQYDYAAVVFEPCHHKVLCRECATKYCPDFCPQCYALIVDRLLPENTVHVQPRVYSAYSFF
jgi:hypothetical protein